MEFKKLNVNPKGVKSGDCVIRAITTATKKDYFEVVDEMVKIYKKTGYIINDKHGYEKYLKTLGYEKQKQPRKPDGKKYTLKEFIDIKAEPNKSYIISLANHLTAVENKVLIDIWDCSHKCVLNYWII